MSVFHLVPNLYYLFHLSFLFSGNPALLIQRGPAGEGVPPHPTRLLGMVADSPWEETKQSKEGTGSFQKQLEATWLPSGGP